MIRRLLWGAAVLAAWLAALWRCPADLLLLLLLAWAFAHRAPPAPLGPLWVGACLGGMKDLASSGPMGIWLVVFAATAWMATRIAGIIARDHPVPQLLWVGLFAAGTTVAYALLLGARGAWPMAGPLVVYWAVPSAVVTALASLALFPLLRRLRAAP